ncbi:PREDICTED: uncharacterized protein LOC105558953 [Vollenhovia emeryi]|uniref:uncharacterized protein LOC105558953 n=1 Tax=Vollenhovia emeryi TaxID=411798 RepID=UPI0005F4951D|nr:PREDICTED: uncharacterized protein LOC105558953 [Vollenhovia emeryi]
MNRKQPIRTYQRKTTKRPVAGLLTLSAISSEKYSFVENNHFGKSGTCNDSLNHDPFETTFDRIAKGAVVPPMPLDTNQNNSWKGSSSGSDINDTTNIKALTSDVFMCNNDSTYVSKKLVHKCKKRNRREPEVTITAGTLTKRIRSRARGQEKQSGKSQGQKKRANKVQKKKILKNTPKSGRVCNGQVSYVNCNAIDNSRDVSYINDILCDKNYERLHQNVLKSNEKITSPNKSIGTNDSVADFKRTANYQQVIKPCFVKLNPCTVQNYISNREKITENKQDILHNAKLYTNTLLTVSSNKEQDIISSTPIGKRVKPSISVVTFSPINYNTCDKLQWTRESVITAKEDITNVDQKGSRSSIAEYCKLDPEDVQEQQTQILLRQQSHVSTDSAIENGITSRKNNIRVAITPKYETECNVETKIPYSSKNTSAMSTDQSRSLFDEQQEQLVGDNEQATRINAIESVCENGSHKDETINISRDSVLSGENRDNNIDDACVLLTRLQDPIRIGRRMQYPKWHMSNISYSSNDEATQSNNEISRIATDKNISNVQSAYNSEHSKNAINSFLDHSTLFKSTTRYNSINKQMDKSVILKPGKYWARTLSILNNINDESDLDKLSVGKGKKWRHSVRDVLEMQKQGIFQSCLKTGKDDTHLSSDTLSTTNISSFNSNECKKFNLQLANHAKFSKRISVRVVLNSTSTKHDIKDTSFLEAFRITPEKSPNLKLSHQEESLIHNDQIISHSTAARDIVLQRCSQNCYVPFADRFPDSYLKHCHKIGEGVYGEVFLHERDGNKSVIKIIPIENEQLVNGERQKKFSEILSEIVIAKELDDLKLHATYKTNGFVEVKSISCIIGKYPERLIELWNIYDNDKTSDNDCPSMLGENQLYIALELGHGGEDLEAFIFQTAEEAYALFLQITLALASAERALEFEHRDLHWGNVLVSRTKEPYINYNLDGREIRFPSKGVKVSIIDFTLSRMLYQGYCMYNDLALDPALFTAHGEYQFEIYRLMRDKIQNNWQKFEPYTNVLWLHYTLNKMITAVRYKKKNLKVHKDSIKKLKDFQETILNYSSAYDFVINCTDIVYL